MQVHFTPPPNVASVLARLDPRWRLVGLLVLILTVAAVRSLAAASIGLALALLLTLVARTPWRWFVQRLAMVVFLIGLFTLPMPIFSSDWRVGMHFAAVILCKSLSLFTLAGVLLITAPLETTLKAAHSLRMPGLLVQIALLSYRYLFVLGDELVRLRVALRTRGFRNRPDLHSWRTVGAAAGTLLARGHDRAERVACAMRCRGFDGQFRTLTGFHTRWFDVAFVLAALASATGMVTVDVMLLWLAA